MKKRILVAAVVGITLVFSACGTAGTVDVTKDASESSGEMTTAVEVETQEDVEKELELVDSGWYMEDPEDETTYINVCGMIHNPNKTLIAEYPRLTVTVKKQDGSIAATEDLVGSAVLPEDTITLCRMLSVNTKGLGEKPEVNFELGSNDFVTSSSDNFAKTTDLVISNVSEQNGEGENFITGELKNKCSKAIKTVNISLVLRKDGKIVFVDETYLYDVQAGKTKAFEFSRYNSWPEHDKIEISAMQWM